MIISVEFKNITDSSIPQKFASLSKLDSCIKGTIRHGNLVSFKSEYVFSYLSTGFSPRNKLSKGRRECYLVKKTSPSSPATIVF